MQLADFQSNQFMQLADFYERMYSNYYILKLNFIINHSYFHLKLPILN
jgi:hypothetical protein